MIVTIAELADNISLPELTQKSLKLVKFSLKLNHQNLDLDFMTYKEGNFIINHSIPGTFLTSKRDEQLSMVPFYEKSCTYVCVMSSNTAVSGGDFKEPFKLAESASVPLVI